MLEADKLCVRYGGRTVVENLSFRLHEGQWLMLVGPNGAGKTTLINAVAQGVPYAGHCLLKGQDMRCMKPMQIAKTVGVLSQHHSVNYAYTVEEIVRLGRYAHRSGLLGNRDPQGNAPVEHALALTGLEHLRYQPINALSGGEVQRAFLAQVLAQEPQVLLLDEPANHLDLRFQQQLFELIVQWLHTPGRAVLSVVHDLSLARRFGTNAILMHQGRSVAQGDIETVLTREKLQSVYDMDVYAWMQEILAPWQG